MQTTVSDKKFKIIFAAWWLDWAIVHTVVLCNFNVGDMAAITDSVVTNTILAASCWLISNNMRFYLPRQERFWYILVISIVLSFISIFTIKFILRFIFKDDAQYLLFVKDSSIIRFWIAFLLVGSTSMMSLLWYSQKDQQQMDMRRTEAEKLEREAELFKLRQQLQPHFLFNSLNSISALTGSQPEKARHMIHQLSEFLRGTLKKEEQHWNTLEEELQYLQLYLDIENVRFGHRLKTEVTFSDEAMPLKLPALLLQPVVENAIKFGLYDTIENVLITLNAVVENNYLKIVIQNPFDPETSQPLKGTGFGLSSVTRRLFLLFARHDLLKIEKDNKLFYYNHTYTASCMKIIIIDDEPLARIIVKEYLQSYAEIKIAAECDNGFEGMKAIQHFEPDLIFLDIQMPKINGFEMLELFENPPPVIFTTAFDEFAIKAFESSAVDYLLKPFSKERFDKAVQKFLQQRQSLTKQIQPVIETAAQSPEQQNRIVVKDGNKIKIIPVTQIYYLEAADDYVKIITGEGSFLKKRTMSFFEQSLSAWHFVRIHRSYIVNTQLITRIDAYEKDGHLVLLNTGARLPASKTGYAKLKEVLGI